MRKRVFTLLSPFIVVVSCKGDQREIDTKVSKQGDSITKQVMAVAEFTGQQVTGVTVTSTRTDFRELSMEKGVENSVEITKIRISMKEEMEFLEIGVQLKIKIYWCSICSGTKTNFMY
jgi:hypothetical protein